jgi:hypothetical protein
MPVFRLEPIDVSDPCWAFSHEKEPIWAEAGDAWSAREVAATKALQAIKMEPGIPIPISPWQNEKLTLCVRDPSIRDLSPGDVVRADGSEVGQN